MAPTRDRSDTSLRYAENQQSVAYLPGHHPPPALTLAALIISVSCSGESALTMTRALLPLMAAEPVWAARAGAQCAIRRGGGLIRTSP
jgi:hypothetical protein